MIYLQDAIKEVTEDLATRFFSITQRQITLRVADSKRIKTNTIRVYEGTDEVVVGKIPKGAKLEYKKIEEEEWDYVTISKNELWLKMFKLFSKMNPSRVMSIGGCPSCYNQVLIFARQYENLNPNTVI